MKAVLGKDLREIQTGLRVDFLNSLVFVIVENTERDDGRNSGAMNQPGE